VTGFVTEALRQERRREAFACGIEARSIGICASWRCETSSGV
jgi:hypothetical protein